MGPLLLAPTSYPRRRQAALSRPASRDYLAAGAEVISRVGSVRFTAYAMSAASVG